MPLSHSWCQVKGEQGVHTIEIEKPRIGQCALCVTGLPLLAIARKTPGLNGEVEGDIAYIEVVEFTQWNGKLE